jgi:DNA-binding NarL/FixJ family response regulator
LIVDDHPGFRALARRLLESTGFDVVGEAEDGASAIEMAHELRPSLVLLDVQLPDLDGFEVAHRLAAAGLDHAIVLVSSRDRTAYRRRLASAPVRGFIAKGELSGDSLAELVS